MHTVKFQIRMHTHLVADEEDSVRQGRYILVGINHKSRNEPLPYYSICHILSAIHHSGIGLPNIRQQ